MNTDPLQERRLLHPLKTLNNYQDTVSNELRLLASPHTENSEYIDLLPVDYDTHPAQKITHVFIDGNPSSAEEISQIATASNSAFPDMLHRLESLESSQRELSRANEYLAGGDNLVVVTNHGDIRDIAEVLASFHVGLKKSAETQQEPANFTTILMLSKMVTHLAIYGNSAVDTVGLLCDRQYFSFPRTNSMKGAGISDKTIELYNKAVRGIMRHQLAQGSNLLGIAASGTTEKAIESDSSHLGMARVTPGTTKILMSPRTKVVPVAIWRDEENPVFEVLDIPRGIRSETDIHKMMGAIATTLSEKVHDKTFTYLG